MYSTASTKNRLRVLLRRLKGRKGNAIVYIAMVLIIFGVIGVVMTSLLTSSIVSTTTPNHFRRALYMTEAGMRYALSELRNTEDWTDRIQDLNNTIYTVSAGETFTLNIFGPWYQSGSYQSKSTGQILTLTVPEGEMPPDYTFDTSSPYLSIVNNNYSGSSIQAGSVAEIDGFTRIDANTVEFNLRDDFIVDDTELVCLAVNIDPQSVINNPIDIGDTLYVAEQARHVFPQYDGAIEVNRNVYFYDELVYINNRVELRNITKRPESVLPYTADVSHYAILSPRNHIIVATGVSENISAGGNLSESVNVADRSQHDEGIPPPDIDADEFTDNISEIETPVPGYISTDTDADSLSLGGNYNPPADAAFGAGWYDANKAVGGDEDYCQAGACLYALGFRTFFTLDYTGNADGLTFSAINGANNNAVSIGGDIEQSELLAYAGDSRTNVAGTAWLDGIGDGLQSPKMAVEFDTLVNFDAAFESTLPLNYCSGSNLKPDTRKDPVDNGSRDAVQYVYWGNTTLDIPCRNDDPSYDDNRHDAEGTQTSDWPAPFTTSGDVRSKAVIGPNDTLYVTTMNGYLHAINIVDGTEKWTFPDSDAAVPTTGDFLSDPALNDSGDTVYVAERDGSTRRILAIDTSNGIQKWSYPTDRTDESSPAVDRNGVVYIGASVSSSTGELYAINPNGTEKWTHVLAEEIESDVIVDRTGGLYDGYIYVGTDGGAVLQISPNSATGVPEWTFAVGPDIEVAPALSADGSIVYGLGENGTVYAINASDGLSAWGSNPDTSGSYHDVDPAVDTSGGVYDGTIYIMNSDQDGLEGAYLSSVKTDGSGFNWERVPVKDAAAPTPEHSKSSPTVGPDGSIYVGTDDDHVYAIDPSDGSVKWRLNLGANVRSSATVGVDGTVYIGSDDNKVFAIANYALPRNRRDLYITSTGAGINVQVGGEDVDVDNENNWLAATAAKKRWAVRIEVMRSLVANAFGNYEYTLHSWVRQCDLLDCSDVIGTFYQDTRIEYDAKTPQLAQTVELSAADHALFDRFLFGFTTSTGAGTSQNAVIEFFQLSFIRPGDPVIAADPDWP